MKTAIVYDRVNKWGGAERVLLALHRIFPKAPLYTSVYDPKGAPWAEVFPKVYTSFLQKLPLAKANHELFAPLMPLAFSLFDFSKYDLVISVTSEYAKGIKTGKKTLHICYCLTPTRYLWSGYNSYFKNRLIKFISAPIIYFLKKWDRKVAKAPNVLVAISKEVQKRINKYYKRESAIIFPPVEMASEKVSSSQQKERKYYLLVSRLDYGYKKVDLAIRTFNKLGYPLMIVGTGREEKKLKNIASKNIFFAGRVTDAQLKRIYLGAKALIMPQEEDFGIVAVEAQSLGVPVVAFNKGGAQDTVIDGKTGILFPKQSVKSLAAAIRRFEKKKFVVDNLYTNANRFSEKIFKKEILKLVNLYNK